MFGGINIFQALKEKHYTSNKRLKENDFLYAYHIVSGLFFIGISFFFIILTILSFLSMLFINISMNLFIFPAIIFVILVEKKYPVKRVKEAKKLKLADEIYLDRVSSLRLKDLWLDNYKFIARMVKIYGKEKTSLFYSTLALMIFVIIMVLYDTGFKILSEYFSRNIVVMIFSFIAILLFFTVRYMLRNRIEDALNLASYWRGDLSNFSNPETL